MYQSALQELQAQQIQQRCLIANLYGELMRITPPNTAIVGAAHEWGLTHIETLVADLVTNIPSQKPLKNIYSEHVLMAGTDAAELTQVIAALVEALDQHKTISTRIEQFGKGVA